MAVGDAYDLDKNGQIRYPTAPARPAKPVVDEEYKRRVLTTLNQGGELSDQDRRWVEKEYNLGPIQRLGGSLTSIEGEGAVEQSPYWARRVGKNWEGFRLQGNQNFNIDTAQDPKPNEQGPTTVQIRPLDTPMRVVRDQQGNTMRVPLGTEINTAGQTPTANLAPYASSLFNTGNYKFPAVSPQFLSNVAPSQNIPTGADVLNPYPTARFSGFNPNFYKTLWKGDPAFETPEWTQQQAEDARQFQWRYYRSPRFREMVGQAWGNAPLTERFASWFGNWNTVNDLPATMSRLASTTPVYVTRPGDVTSPGATGSQYQRGRIDLNPRMDAYNAGGFGGASNVGETAAHEFGHSGEDMIVPQWQQEEMARRLKPASEDNRNQRHGRNWYETRSDLNALRYLANRLQIYDAGTQAFTAEHLQQLQQQFNGANQPISLLLRRLLANYAPKDIIWLMNNVARNAEQNAVPDNYA